MNMTKKKQQPKKVKPDVDEALQKAETQGRIDAFNKEVAALAAKYQVTLDVQHTLIVLDAKPRQ
jgi:hypothetical protein